MSSANTGVQALSEKVLEDIKVRCCFVTKKNRADQLALPRSDIVPPPDVKYPHKGVETFVVSGKVREKAFEVLYEEVSVSKCFYYCGSKDVLIG